MDLEEYRRAYMQAEGFGNTPANFVKRISDFANNVSSIPDAINRDRIEHKERKKARGKAREDMKENGVSVKNAVEYAKNIPNIGGHTLSKTDKALNSGINAAISVNELGQTAASIAGTKRSNLYDGQDLENGIRFSLKASKELAKGLKLPAKAFYKAEQLTAASVMLGGAATITAASKIKGKIKERGVKTKERTLPSLSEPER